MTKTKTAELSALQKALARPVPAEIAELTAKLKSAMANVATAREADDEFRASRAGNVDELTAQLARAETRADVARRIDGDIPADLASEVEKLRNDLSIAQAARDGRKERLEAFSEEIERRRNLVWEAWRELQHALADWKDKALDAADQQLAEAARLVGEAYGVAEALRRETTWERPSHFMGVAGHGSHDIKSDIELPTSMRAALHEAWRANFILNRP